MTSNGEPGSEQAQCLEVPQKDARLAGNQRATLPHHAGLGNLLAVLTDKIYMLPDLRAVRRFLTGLDGQGKIRR
jgi:hypothetical protein